ncbi:MAG TPA: glycosyltransferase family 2 protein [Anaerolineae bacterium]|nr:glycosyltransferase family 2 protein [Anaerolineae bacterium]
MAKQKKIKQSVGNPHIAVVIPAYNVATHIRNVIKNIPPEITNIIVVDDVSKDETASVVRRTRSKRLHLLKHKKNCGVGGAVLTGCSYALELGAEIIVKMDSDGQMDPTYLTALIQPIIDGKADYTKGNRFLHARELRKMPLKRRIGNLGLTFLTKLASGYWNIFDPTNGFTAIHRDVLRSLDTEAIAWDYFFETSMLLELHRLQAKVMDVPMPARYADEPSSISLTHSLVNFPGQLLFGFLKRLYQQYLLFDFNAASIYFLLGLPLLLFGVLWGLIHWYISIDTGEVASTGTVLIAVLPIILGVQFLTQALSLDIHSVPQQAIHTCEKIPTMNNANHSLTNYWRKQTTD